MERKMLQLGGGWDDDDLPLLVGDPSSSHPLWIGTPALHTALTPQGEGDAFFSKVGGLPVLFRAIDRDAECSLMRCPSCGKTSSVRLVCQLYAPIEATGMDRVLYILQCEKCGTKERAMLFAFRSSSYNPELLSVPAATGNTTAAPEAVPAAAPLFEETDDWGDDDDDGGGGGAKVVVADNVPPAAPEAPVVSVPPGTPTTGPCPPRVSHSIAPLGVVAPNASPKNVLRCIALELFVDNSIVGGSSTRGRQRGKGATTPSERLAEDQLLDVERTCGAEAVDRTSIEHDDETADDRCARQYMECIGYHPAQCVQWHMGGVPILCRLDEVPPASIPPCDHCGAARRFECQLMSPLIYFMTRGSDEARHTLHYGVVLVYTCSADCDALPYNKEYCFVQSEI